MENDAQMCKKMGKRAQYHKLFVYLQQILKTYETNDITNAYPYQPTWFAF